MRLVRISQYLSSLSLFIYYKFEKLNIILDILSKLQLDILLSKKLDILKVLYNYFINLYKSNIAIKVVEILLNQILVYYIILVEITNNLKQRLKIVYVNNYY